MKLYTIGEIFRLGLFKTWKGTTLKTKAHVASIVLSLPYKEKKTPWGVAKCLTERQIKEYNKKRIM